MEKTIIEILYPTVAVQAGFLNKRTIKNNIPTQIRGIIEGRIKTEKYIEKKNGGKTNKWDIRTA